MNEHDKYILFIGDSFAAHGLKACNVGPTVSNTFLYYTPKEGEVYYPWTDQVATHFSDHGIINVARAGQSWVYYQQEMNQFFLDNPEHLDKIDIVVACHTGPDRLPSNRPTLYKEDQVYPGQSVSTKELILAQKYYETYIKSDSFHEWTTIKWFEDFSEMFKNKKVINFHNFETTMHLNKYLTHSMNFINISLVSLSASEFTGTESSIIKQMNNDSRTGHFCKDNHKAMADQVISAIENYKEGNTDIDRSKWYQPNPMGINWTSGKNFGSI